MARVISDECISCGACADTCPVSAISEGDGKYVVADISYDYLRKAYAYMSEDQLLESFKAIDRYFDDLSVRFDDDGESISVSFKE